MLFQHWFHRRLKSSTSSLLDVIKSRLEKHNIVVEINNGRTLATALFSLAQKEVKSVEGYDEDQTLEQNMILPLTPTWATLRFGYHTVRFDHRRKREVDEWEESREEVEETFKKPNSLCFSIWDNCLVRKGLEIVQFTPVMGGPSRPPRSNYHPRLNIRLDRVYVGSHAQSEGYSDKIIGKI
ncbi:hypothetical protein EV361DRAFT_957190 [Lentinula raphanica]|nr:hypothetical protein EV361DRAFT_957190 [Lentinula raphanica]